jgi:predicted nucleic acid-binding protein
VIVCDASVIVEILLRTPAASQIEERLFAQSEDIHAPALLDVEVAQVLRRYERTGELSAVRGTILIDLLARLPVTRHAHEALLSRIWTLRANMTAYDAAYIALAEALGATFITRDRALSRSRSHGATVLLV